MQENILIKENIPKLFVKFSTPAIISMLISGLQIVIDGMFVGNIIGPNAMAGINIAQPFFQVIIGFSMILSIGSQSFIGITLGEGDREKGRNIFKTTVIVTAIIGLLVTIVGLFFSESLAKMLGANEVLVGYTSDYIKTIAIFAIPMSLMFLFGFIDRILGKPELYFKGMVLSLLMNLILNYILVAKLNYGVAGSAIATGLSYSSAFFIVIWPVLNRKNEVNLFKGKYDTSTIKTVLYNGSSEGITAISTALTAYIFNTAFMKIGGEAGVAAFTAINYVIQFQICIMFGISDGIGPIISYNYGSEKNDRVRQLLILSAKTIIVIGVITFIGLFIFSEEIISMFVKGDETIIELATRGGKIAAIAFLFNGFNIVCSGYFTSIGKAKESVMVSSSRGIIFIVIGTLLLPRLFGIDGVWFIMAFAEIVTLAVCVYSMKKNRNKALY